MLSLGSLFSGYGGLDMAVHAAFGDVTTAWVSDFDTGPCKILAHRYPHVPNIGDITAIDWTQVEPVDIIAGGFPCQDVSLAGRRAGMTEGTRSNLWGAMRTAIETIRPRYVVAENVRGLLSATATSNSDMEPDSGPLGDAGTGHLRALGRVLGDLADLGYDAAWCGLRAADIGAPHGRFRVFIVAEDSLRGGSGGWPCVASDRTRERVDATADRTDSGPDSSRQREVALLPTPTTSEANGIGAHGTGGADLRTTIALLPTPNTMDTLPRRDGQAREKALHRGGETSRRASTGNLREEVPTSNDWGAYAPAIQRWEQTTRPAPHPTEPNPKTGKPQLSARFTEWMMGLPDGWITDVPGITRAEAIKACGNGVVPQQGAHALNYLLSVA